MWPLTCNWMVEDEREKEETYSKTCREELKGEMKKLVMISLPAFVFLLLSSCHLTLKLQELDCSSDINIQLYERYSNYTMNLGREANRKAVKPSL